MRRLLLIPLLIAMPLTGAAQRMGFAHFPGHSPGLRTSDFHRDRYPGAYYTLPLFYPFDSDYVSSAAYPAPSQPTVILLQAPPTAAQPEPPAPAQPLMIELQGDHYVQISGDQVSAAQMIDRMPSTQQAIHTASTTSPKLQRTSTVLVFRDGHDEEISDYTIADGVLYAAADYYTSGSWNQKIALSSLNLPETITSNRARGVQFHVPSSPNEVIVGP